MVLGVPGEDSVSGQWPHAEVMEQVDGERRELG